MKKLALLLFVVIAFAGCEKTTSVPADDGTITLTVASIRPVGYETTAMFVDGKPLSPKYVYKTEDGWKLWYYSISRFDRLYVEGFEYVIRVRKAETVDPATGITATTYALDEIISKEEKVSEGVPEWMTVILPFEKTITIASVKPVLYEGTVMEWFGAGIPAKYIYKDWSDWTLWYSYDPISGFDDIYEEGYEYKLILHVEKVEEIMMDGSYFIYELQEIVSKVKKASEGVPEWMYVLPAHRTITIASVRPKGYGKEGSAVYIFKEGGVLPWRTWGLEGLIDGFDDVYEEGYEYELLLQVLYVDDAPKDKFGRRYKVENIISKVKKDSEDIPEWM